MPHTWCFVADNPSSYTFNGSNVWIVEDRNREGCVVIDPGPSSERHLHTLLAICQANYKQVYAVLVTHDHEDHYGCASAFARMAGAPAFLLADQTLSPGACPIKGFDRHIECIHTPGHSLDTVVFYIPEDSSLFIGDICFEKSSSLVGFPDGKLDLYLESLDTLVGLIESRHIRHVLPGHKEPMNNPARQMRIIKERRLDRVKQVVEACQGGIPMDADSLMEVLYPGIEEGLRWGAQATLQATIEYAREFGLSSP